MSRRDKLKTALMFGDMDAVAEAVASGADLNAPTGSMEDPLWFEIFPQFEWSEFKLENIRRAIELGARVDARNGFQQNALLYFVAWNLPVEPDELEDRVSLEIVEELLELGLDVNALDKDRQSVLHAVCADRNTTHDGLRTKIAERLLAAGADIEARSGWPHELGWTPLMIAAKEGRAGIVRLLVDKGANVAAQSPADDPSTALSLALGEGHEEIATVLRESGASESPERERRQRLFHALDAGDYAAALEVADQVLKDFPDDARVYHCVAGAHANSGHYVEAEGHALAGLELQHRVGLVSILFFAWLKQGRFEDVIHAWENEHVQRIRPSHSSADYVLSHVLVAYMSLNREEDAKRSLGMLLPDVPNPNPTLLFNVACLFGKTNDPVAAMYWGEKCLEAGHDPEGFRTDPDFDSVREHPVFQRWLSRDRRRPQLDTMLVQTDDGPLRLTLRGDETITRTGRSDKVEKHENEIAALFAWHAERAQLLAVHEEIVGDEEAWWIGEIQEYLSQLAGQQQDGSLERKVGALVIEWDYPNNEGEFQHQLIPEDYEDVDAATEFYQSYQGTTELTLAEDHFVSGPRILSPGSFSRIVAEVCASKVFASLDHHAVFFWVYQEHDSRIEFTARWPSA